MSKVLCLGLMVLALISWTQWHRQNSEKEEVSAMVTAVRFVPDTTAETTIEERRPTKRFLASVSPRAIPSQDDLEALIPAKGGQDDPKAMEPLLAGLRLWAEKEGPAAARWLNRMSPGPERRAAQQQVAIGWADYDLTGAARWAQSLPAGSDRDCTILDISYEAARFSPTSALTLAGALQPSRERNDLLVHAVAQWADAEPEKALAWVAQVPDVPLRQAMVAAAAVVVSEENGETAADWLERYLADTSVQSNATVSVVQRWVRTAPLVAADWVSRLPESNMRREAVRDLIAGWFSESDQSAFDWLQHLPPSPFREDSWSIYQNLVAQAPAHSSGPLPEHPVEDEDSDN